MYWPDYLRWLSRYLAFAEAKTSSAKSITPSRFTSLPPEFVAEVMDPEVKKPDWPVWQTKDNTATAWQACLLSLDIDPDGVNPDNIDVDGRTYTIGEQHTQRDYAPAPGINAQFSRRLRWLMEALLDEEDFPSPKNLLATVHQEIYLSTFATWCQKSHVDMPPQLPVRRILKPEFRP